MILEIFQYSPILTYTRNYLHSEALQVLLSLDLTQILALFEYAKYSTWIIQMYGNNSEYLTRIIQM